MSVLSRCTGSIVVVGGSLGVKPVVAQMNVVSRHYPMTIIALLENRIAPVAGSVEAAVTMAVLAHNRDIGVAAHKDHVAIDGARDKHITWSDQAGVLDRLLHIDGVQPVH